MGDLDSDSHLIHASYVGLPIGALTGYAYLLDFENDAPTLSSQTYGAQIKGEQKLANAWKLSYLAEYAQQRHYADNPNHYQTHYYHIAPSMHYDGVSVTAGYEVLGRG